MKGQNDRKEITNSDVVLRADQIEEPIKEMLQRSGFSSP